jgi:hypothetical protein
MASRLDRVSAVRLRSAKLRVAAAVISIEQSIIA